MTARKDLHLEWSGDIQLAANGDLQLVDESELTRQRVLRRLLTSPGDYIWAMGYGAGLGRLIGTPIDIRAVEAMVRLQMRHEMSVLQSPPPTVRGPHAKGLGAGTFTLSVEYKEVESGSTQSMTLDLAV